MSIPLVLAMDEKAAVAAAAMAVFAFVYVVYSIRRVKETREVEQTKREVAAYVAEGSITPDDAVKILLAGKEATAECVGAIADSVAWGVISPAKAERLIRAMRDDKGRAQAAPQAAT